MARGQTNQDRRLNKLVTGTNWPPRTEPTPGKGYFFFQGPTPKTAVQDDLPSFFSAENFADIEIKPVQVAVTVSGFTSLLLILAGLNSAPTGLQAPPPAAAVKTAPAPPPPAAEKEE